MAVITFDEYCGLAAEHMDDLCALLRKADGLIGETSSNIRVRLNEYFVDPTKNDCLNIAAVAMFAAPDDVLDRVSITSAIRHNANNRLQFLMTLFVVMQQGPVQQEVERIALRAKKLLMS